MLTVHRAERSDALVAALGQQLRAAPADPFQPIIVAVPSRGVERWLAQQLSLVLGAADGDGVCANVQFPALADVLDDALAQAAPDYADSLTAWQAEHSVWTLHAILQSCDPAEEWCAPLLAQLGRRADPAGSGRVFAAAAKLSRLFERYGRARPELLLAWRDRRDEQGDSRPLPADLRWQAELWRRLRVELGVPAPPELLEPACAQLGPGPALSIFGATRLSPARVRTLAALAAEREIGFWLHHPSPALWQAIAAAGERPGPRSLQPVRARHPLLASMARDVRELQQLLAETVHESQHHPAPSRPQTLLGRLQAELAADEPPADRLRLPVTDTSVRVHAAHGPARQVEVLREAILGLLEADGSLQPRDVVVMCPDIESYAPLLAATFGLADEPGGHPAAGLRVSLADRALRQVNPMLDLIAHLLDLAASRATATELLDLAGLEPVRCKFGFDGDELERLRDWAASAGARWGFDAEHRRPWGLAGLGQGTWRAALDRLLLGVAMEDGQSWVGDAVPVDDVDSADIDLAGRFAELVDRCEAFVTGCGGLRPIGDWLAALQLAADELGVATEPWQLAQLRGELADLMGEAAGSRLDSRLGLAEVRLLLAQRLAGRPSRASFRTGALTVCTLVPMRAVPHRVVCLLGMDDAVFPRHGVPDGDDILARDPRSGERDPRSEDRQLFLDAIGAAQEHLIITYTGADPRTGAQVPPCVPLGELLDAIDATALAAGGSPASDQVVVRHPLQPFDRRNFEPNRLGRPGPFSFDPAGLAGAQAAAGARSEPRPLLSEPLPPQPDEPVNLAELITFFQHPARGFLRQRLQLAPAAAAEDPEDAVPIELDGLQRWAIGDRVLQLCLAGASPRTAAQLEFRRGQLPPGPLGERTMRAVGRQVEALLRATEGERAAGDPHSLDLAVDVAGGRQLVGTIAGVRQRTLLSVSYSRLAAKHRLAAWIRYLALVAGTGTAEWRAVTVGGDRGDARRSVLAAVGPDRARSELQRLVLLRDAGLRAPLPMALETSHTYADRRHRGAAVVDALPGAQQRWETDRFDPERDQPENLLAFGSRLPFDRLLAETPAPDEEYPDENSRFGALARLVWEPLLAAEGSRP